MAARKAVWSLVPVALVVLIVSQRQDIMRYLKIKQMSYGSGHPENVPVAGHTAYPEVSHDGESGRPAGTSTADDLTSVDPQEPIDDSSPTFQRG